MKKVLLGLVLCGTATAPVFAQQSVGPMTDAPQPGAYITDQTLKLAPQTKGERSGSSLSRWYSYLDEATTNLGIEFKFFNNSSIFPDTSVKQIYGDGNGGMVAGDVGIFGEGVVFDPKSPAFGDTALTRWHKYMWDSALIFITGYKRWPENPNADTLIVQFYTTASPSGITKTTLNPGNDKTAIVKYDYKKNLGTGAKTTVKYLLTDRDTGAAGFHGITIPVDSVHGGLIIPADGLCALTVSFRPGYAYSIGDTLDERLNPMKRLNHLRLAIGEDASKTSDESYNNGLRIIKENRYNKSKNWNGVYIVGDAWPDFNEFLYAAFHINFNFNPGFEEDAFKGYGLNQVYPNPVSRKGTIGFSLGKSETVNITLYNSLGQPVHTLADGRYPQGQNTVAFDAGSLKAGVYFYTIKAGRFTKTLSLSIAK